MAGQRSRSTGLHRISKYVVEAGLVFLAVGIPLAIGGVHRATILVAALVSCFTFIALLYSRPGKFHSIHVPWFAYVLFGLMTFIGFQLIPLPIGLLRFLAPSSAEVLEVSLAGAGGLPDFHAISLAPIETLWEMIKAGTYTLTFITAHNYYYRHPRRNRLLYAFVISGTMATLAGYLGAVVAPGKALMLYEPSQGLSTGLITTSFVNPNHSAAFLTLCTMIAIGLCVSTRDLHHRVLIGLGGVLIGSGVFLTLSRGGILALALGMGILALLLLEKKKGEERSSLPIIVPGAMALILALSAWLAYDTILAEFKISFPEDSSGLGKISLWSSGLKMVLANPWVGVGRGAFFAAFPRYLTGDVVKAVSYSHLENQYLHLPAEVGVICGGSVVIFSAIALFVWYRKHRHARTAALTAGLIALACHNLFDFNLEMLGIALPVVILSGLLSVDGGKDRPSHKRWHTRWAIGLSLACMILVLAGVFWATIHFSTSADQYFGRLNRLMEQKAPMDRIKDQAREAVRQYPADYMPHLLMGHILYQRRQPEALAWLNQAMFLFPNSSSIHLETARALVAFGHRDQALFEYRCAMKNGSIMEDIVKEALALSKNMREVEKALPKQDLAYAHGAMALLSSSRINLATETANRAYNQWPKSVPVVSAYIEVLLKTQRSHQAEIIAKNIAVINPVPEVYHLWARAAGSSKSGADIPIFLKARRLFPDDDSFSFSLAESYLRGKDLPKAVMIAEEILKNARSISTLARAHEILAHIHQEDGRPHRAHYEAEQARKIRAGF